VGADAVQHPSRTADTRCMRMRLRLRDESGFGLLELLIAMVILNVGLFAVVGAFNGATVAIARAGTVSSATAVADKQMEIYRSLQNCAIWIDAASFPVKDAGSAYQADTKAYTDLYTTLPVAFFDKSASATNQGLLPWSTSATSAASNVPWNGDIPTSCTPTANLTPPSAATKAVQDITGPDGAAYHVYTYIVISQPSSGTYVKQVTVVVRDPRDVSKILVRETSLFNPING
jgi:type II secretory pathway pseudopilin PulG